MYLRKGANKKTKVIAMEKIFKAIGDFSRVRIISLLLDDSLCVTELSNIMRMSVSAVSRHLSRLNLVGIIDDRHEAQWVYYKVSDKFADENRQLLEYIRKTSKKDAMMLEDKIRKERYSSSEYCCRDLTNCKEQVEKVMNGEND